MKIQKIKIHNYRSIIDAKIEAHDYLMLVGENNAGKSNVVSALRCFYENLKWNSSDLPKLGRVDDDSWVELSFILNENEWENIAEKYHGSSSDYELVLKRYFAGDKVKSSQSNIYAVIDGKEEDTLFYGAKNISTAKCGSVVYIPALTTLNDQMKTSGPSPLRDILNFILKKTVSSSTAFASLIESFDKLNSEAKADTGFLTEILKPINSSLEQWGVEMDFSINSIKPEDITKSLIQYQFIDSLLDGNGMDLDKFGHGFQRSVIYELLKLVPKFNNKNNDNKKDFNPDFTLLLFEEPEAFLHPPQQEKLADSLRKIGKEEQQQVFITSHSSVFVGKSSGDLGMICRIVKNQGISEVYQVSQANLDELFLFGQDCRQVLIDHVADIEASPEERAKSYKELQLIPDEELGVQLEYFRYNLWLNSDRSSMFFASRVLIVEGATEKALFNYLLANEWSYLCNDNIVVVDALGKFNIHRFMELFKYFGIPHGVIFDDDNHKTYHKYLNKFIIEKKNKYSLNVPQMLDKDLENFLSFTKCRKQDQKPIYILKAITNGEINHERFDKLKQVFCDALALELQ